MKRKNITSNSSFLSNASFDKSFDKSTMIQEIDEVESFKLYQKMRQDLRKDIEKVDKEGHALQEKLEKRIEMMMALRKKESEDIYNMQIELNQLQASRDSLIADVEEVDEKIRSLYDDLSRYKALINENTEEYSNLESVQKMKVPRLRNQITLYASISGIKWEYDNEKMLEGTVTIPSKETVKSFSIDPTTHSRYEIANQLWGIITGAE